MTGENENQDQLDAHWLLCDKPQVFAALVNRYQQPVFAFLGRMGFSQTDAEDLAQEIFLKVWKNRHRYDPTRARVITWIFTIARNLALNEHRRLTNSPLELSQPPPVADLHPDSCPATTTDAAQTKARLQLALATLSAQDKSTIALAFADTLSSTECARLERCSVATFRTRVNRARNRLIAAYNQLESATPDKNR